MPLVARNASRQRWICYLRDEREEGRNICIKGSADQKPVSLSSICRSIVAQSHRARCSGDRPRVILAQKRWTLPASERKPRNSRRSRNGTTPNPGKPRFLIHRRASRPRRSRFFHRLSLRSLSNRCSVSDLRNKINVELRSARATRINRDRVLGIRAPRPERKWTQKFPKSLYSRSKRSF